MQAEAGTANRTHPPWYSGATRGQWLALAAALLGWMFDGFEQGIFPLVARPALSELLQVQTGPSSTADPGVSAEDKAAQQAHSEEVVRRWNGVLSAFFLVGAAAGGVLFGWLGDRLGRVRAMIFSVLTYAVFTGLCGFAQLPWQLAGLRFIAALGMGGEWSLGVALVMESWPSHARPVLAGLIGCAANVGFLLAAASCTLLDPAHHWRLLLLLCVLPALLTFLFRTFVPESKTWVHAASSGPRARVRDIFVPALRRRSFLGAGLGAVALLATWGGVQSIPLWIGQITAGKVTGAVAWAQACSAIGATIGSFLGALLGARFLRRRGYFGLCVLAFLACETLFFVMAGGTYEALLPVIFLVGLSSAAFYGWLPLYLPELFPTRIRATGQGFCYNFGRSLAALGVLLTTFLIDVRGNYARAASLICLVYLVGMVLAWFIPETKGKPLPE